MGVDRAQPATVRWTAVRRWMRDQGDAYRQGNRRPLAGYAALMGIYTGGSLLAGTAAALTGHRLPERISLRDLVPMALTVHKLSRIIAKDPVTSPLRVPFTTFAGTSAPGELSEEVRGEGLAHAVGELLTCPMCLAQWIATSLCLGLVVAPRPTRLVMAAFSAVTGSDVLQHGYVWLQQKS